MIKINKIIPQTVEAFTPDNISLGFINEYEFNDLRIQLKENKVDGYYLMFNDLKHQIDKDGRLPLWSKGFFDLQENQLMKLL
jgi:hypothetical protein